MKGLWTTLTTPNLPIDAFELYTIRLPDRPFHSFRAASSGDRGILCSSGTSCDGFWTSKFVKGSVGYQTYWVLGSSIVNYSVGASCKTSWPNFFAILELQNMEIEKNVMQRTLKLQNGEKGRSGWLWVHVPKVAGLSSFYVYVRGR